MPGQVQIVKITKTTFGGDTRLHELRQFVAACEALSGDEQVTFEQHTGQRDATSTTVTVHGAA